MQALLHGRGALCSPFLLHSATRFKQHLQGRNRPMAAKTHPGS